MAYLRKLSRDVIFSDVLHEPKNKNVNKLSKGRITVLICWLFYGNGWFVSVKFSYRNFMTIVAKIIFLFPFFVVKMFQFLSTLNGHIGRLSMTLSQMANVCLQLSIQQSENIWMYLRWIVRAIFCFCMICLRNRRKEYKFWGNLWSLLSAINVMFKPSFIAPFTAISVQ